MVGSFSIKNLNFTFVLRHRFEKPDEVIGKFRYRHEFRKWELGIWYRFNKMVGKKDFKTPNKWKANLVGSHMLGIDLLICKMWIEINRGGMKLDIPNFGN